MPRPQGDSAQDRLNLWFAIIPFVQLRGEAPVSEIAQHFGVKEERVIHAVRAMANDGADILISDTTDHFNIDWDLFEHEEIVRFTVADALLRPAPLTSKQRSMLIVGLELLQSHPQYRALPDLQPLVEKLRGGSQQIAPLFAVVPPAGTDELDTAQSAIDSRRVVTFTYTDNKGQRTVRTVEPYLIDVQNNKNYLIGWCLDRSAMRTFNFDSLEDLVVTDIEAEPREIDVLSLSRSLFTENDGKLDVLVSIDEDALPLLGGYLVPGATIVKTGERVEVDLPFGHEDSAVRMISYHSGTATIREPESVRSRVADFARAALAAYAESA